MVGDAFQRRARDVGQCRAARQAGDGAARVGLPVGCAQSGEGRHHHHAAGVGDALRQRFDFRAALDGVQAVAQPLHHRAADKHTALQRKLGLRRGLRRAGRQQSVARGLEVRAGVHQQKAAGAVGVLGHAGLETGLAEQGALLVAGDAANQDRLTQQFGLHVAVVGARRLDLGHERHGNVQQVQ